MHATQEITMLPIFLTALNAIFPIALLILLGYWLRHSGFLTQDFLKIGNKLVFRLFLPAMLFVNIYSIEDFSAINWGLVLYSVSVYRSYSCFSVLALSFLY